MKTPTLEEKVEMYERFLHKINMGIVCCNDNLIRQLVANADHWSYMHRVGNGENSEEEEQRLIDGAFWRLCDTK